MADWQLVLRGFRLMSATDAGDPWQEFAADCLAIAGGRIAWLGSGDDPAVRQFRGPVQEGEGRWLSPGLIDCHTHLVYGGNRIGEWEARLAGRSYQDIARAGGGILSTVRATREASTETLYAAARTRVEQRLAEGVTTVEIKSGYGLDVATELKMLEVGADIGRSMPVDVSLTLLAAHAVPTEFSGRSAAYMDYVCDEILPAAAGRCQAVDAFCESIGFSWPQCARVFRAAQERGLGIKIHAEQLTASGSAAAAAKMGAWSADHLEYLAAEDAAVLAEHGTVAVLLPGAYYFLRETQRPPLEALRRAGTTLAIASDCNPGSSPVGSLLLMTNMACTLFGLTPGEALTAVTAGAARALRKERQIGTLELGKQADLVVWEIDSPGELVYNIGGRSGCQQVYKRGECVWSAD